MVYITSPHLLTSCMPRQMSSAGKPRSGDALASLTYINHRHGDMYMLRTQYAQKQKSHFIQIVSVWDSTCPQTELIFNILVVNNLFPSTLNFNLKSIECLMNMYK